MVAREPWAVLGRKGGCAGCCARCAVRGAVSKSCARVRL